MSLSVVDLNGAELVNIPLPAGAVASIGVEWAPDGSSVLLSGCLPCDLKADRSSDQPPALLPRAAQRRPDPAAGGRHEPDRRLCAVLARRLDDRVFDRLVSALRARAGSRPSPWSMVASPSSPHPGRTSRRSGRRTALGSRSSGVAKTAGIYVMDRDGSHLVRLTTAATSTESTPTGVPVWSPDMAWIAFTRDVTDTSLGDLWVVPSAGGEARLLEHNAVADWGPSATRMAMLPPAPAKPSATLAASLPAQVPATAPTHGRVRAPTGSRPTWRRAAHGLPARRNVL